MASKTTSVFLDRFEESFGVLISPDGRGINIPVAFLPDGVREGTALTLTLQVDEAATTGGKEETAALMNELLKRRDA